MSKFPKPINDNVIVLPDKPDAKEVDSGDVYAVRMPEKLEERPRKGVIMSASDGYYAKETGNFVPLSVKEGDMVLFRSFAGEEIKVEGISYLLMKESDINLILKPKA